MAKPNKKMAALGVSQGKANYLMAKYIKIWTKIAAKKAIKWRLGSID
jgi:hypothetical protein